MRIIRNRTIQTDEWRLSPDLSGNPETDAIASPLIVSLTRLLEDAETLFDRNADIGVLLKPEDDLSEIEPYLSRLALVAIEFPQFNEGRGYSQARLLRNRYGFKGELRAVGDVSRDKLAFLERCGFNAYVLRPGESLEAALAGFSEISLCYQPAEDAGDTVLALRRRRVS
ncbi:MAG: DUF934 domain-containing protein [Gammaproteobacteria bacterium]|nr:DUF934 domain-containing protein [Gammaproteobacteria bacterium]MDH3412208.1 DUF934 domain-containing protein [Gammaproteobacteria bacterium]